jgi:hypothetical protein
MIDTDAINTRDGLGESWDFIYLGSCPTDEPALPAGSPRKEQMDQCKLYIDLIEFECGPTPEGTWLTVKWENHEFGSYAEVVCWYDGDNETAREYAFGCEANSPRRWTIVPEGEETEEERTIKEMMWL